MEVIYLGLRSITASIVAAAEEEDADAIGLSMHNAGHLTLGPKMAEAITAAGLDIPLIIGGNVPDEDVEELMDAGIAAVLGPGASAEEVVATVQNAISHVIKRDFIDQRCSNYSLPECSQRRAT